MDRVVIRKGKVVSVTMQSGNAPDEQELPSGSSGSGKWAGLNASDIRQADEVALETRAAIVSCMGLKGRGQGVEFWIGGPGEEVHGPAAAMAFHHVTHPEGAAPLDLA